GHVPGARAVRRRSRGAAAGDRSVARAAPPRRPHGADRPRARARRAAAERALRAAERRRARPVPRRPARRLPRARRLPARGAADVYAAWQQLNGAIKETMDLRLYEVATVAAAGELRSSYCSLAHGKVLFEQFGVAPGDPLDERDRAVQRVARKVVADATSVTQEDLDELRAHGLTEDGVFGVLLAAGARCFLA